MSQGVPRFEIALRVIPIHQVFKERLDEVGTFVLEVEIVGVLPDVDGQERDLALGQRVPGIRRFDDLELVLVEHQPCPAAAELCVAGLLEFLCELVVAAEIGIDLFRDIAFRLAAAALAQTVPEKSVVPDLRRVVKIVAFVWSFAVSTIMSSSDFFSSGEPSISSFSVFTYAAWCLPWWNSSVFADVW